MLERGAKTIDECWFEILTKLTLEQSELLLLEKPTVRQLLREMGFNFGDRRSEWRWYFDSGDSFDDFFVSFRLIGAPHEVIRRVPWEVGEWKRDSVTSASIRIEIVNVQPMTAPTDVIFNIEYRYALEPDR